MDSTNRVSCGLRRPLFPGLRLSFAKMGRGVFASTYKIFYALPNPRAGIPGHNRTLVYIQYIFSLLAPREQLHSSSIAYCPRAVYVSRVGFESLGSYASPSGLRPSTVLYPVLHRLVS